MSEKFWTIGEAARFLGVSESTLRNWDKSGELKPVALVGNQRRYDPKILSQWKYSPGKKYEFILRRVEFKDIPQGADIVLLQEDKFQYRFLTRESQVFTSTSLETDEMRMFKWRPEKDKINHLHLHYGTPNIFGEDCIVLSDFSVENKRTLGKRFPNLHQVGQGSLFGGIWPDCETLWDEDVLVSYACPIRFIALVFKESLVLYTPWGNQYPEEFTKYILILSRDALKESTVD